MTSRVSGADVEIGSPPEASAQTTVLPVTRPPIRQAILVRSDARHSFETFVRTIGVWWPVRQFSPGGGRVRDVTVEGRTGGRVYETWADGTVVEWGELTIWSPPHGFVMTWVTTPAPTEVELTFQALGPALTRVLVEHRGWENLTEEQLTVTCGLPGGYAANAFAIGWAYILSCFAASTELPER